MKYMFGCTEKKKRRSEGIKAIAAIVVCVFVFASASFGSFAKECERVRESTLRLHILAASDTEEDQRLKEKVRDRVLSETGELFSLAGNSEECAGIAENEMERIVAAAKDELIKNGCPYDVSGEVVYDYFGNRTYGDITLPAGRYKAVKLIIGEGKGHNWWCVLFPPLCLPAATLNDDEESLLSPMRVGSSGYKVKFWIIEFFEGIAERFRD